MTFSEAMNRAPLRAFQVVTFVVCMIVLTCDGIDAQLLGIVAPKVIADFGIDRGTFGIAMSAALVGFGFGSWGGGWMGDTVGRRWSLALASLVFALSTVGASQAGGVWSMAAWRLVGGLGFGSAYANAIAMVSEWLPDRWRSVAVTTISVGTPAGGLIAAALAPTLVDAYGWHGSFVVFGLATALVVVLVLAFLRDSPSFLMARGKTDEAAKTARRFFGHDVELVAERHATDGADGSAIGVLDRSNFKLNLGVGIAFAAATLVAYGVLNWTTTLLTAKGFSFEEASYAGSVGGLTSIVASVAAGLLVQRFGSRLVMATVSASLLTTLIVLTFVLESSTAGAYALIVALIGLAAAIFSAGIASLYAIMTYGYPPSCRSAGIGFGIFMGRVGAIAGSGLGGTLIDFGHGSLVPFFAVLCLGAVLISAAALIVDRHVPPARRARAAALA
jgi:AAHS family 4-hydroxybenzoate transporter-like MFS transporter